MGARMNRRRRWVGVITGISMSLLLIGSVAAQSTEIVQAITGGGQPTIAIDSAALSPAAYSAEEQVSSGQLSYTVDAETGASDGWSVSVQTSDLIYSGEHSGDNIPAANLAIATANLPAHVSGDEIDASEGPFAPAGGATGSLDQPRTVLVSNTGFGHGIYSQVLDLQFTIPAGSKVGNYSGTITFTAATGP